MPSEAPLAFFSYARADSQFALQLAKDLKAAGAPVWLDQLDIHAGQRWDKAVEEALANCPRLLVILSPSSVDSNNVMDEVSFALEERKVVIPVLHQECKIPFRLRRVQYVDLRGDYAAGVGELLRVMDVEQKAPLKKEAPPWREPPPLPKQEPTQDRRDVLLKGMLWTARVLAGALAAFCLHVLLTSTHESDKQIFVFLLVVSLVPLAAWKWEWLGGAAAIVLGIAIPTMFANVPYSAVLIFCTPAILFILHRALTSKLGRAHSLHAQE